MHDPASEGPAAVQSECPEAFDHGPLDGRGRCPWCGRKVDSAVPRPKRLPTSDLTEAYRQFYDPDWGATVDMTNPNW